MIRNYFVTAIRFLLKDKQYTIINTIGLAIALAVCLLIYSWIRFETSFDQYFDGGKNIYRVTTDWDDSTEPGMASTYPMIRTRVLSQFPEVEASVRLFNQGFLGSKTRITYQDKIFTNDSFYYADSTFFHVFPFKVIKGNAQSSLQSSNSVVMTESTARKYFDNEDPIGKIISVGMGNKEMVVTAVIENIPTNTHFHFDLLASMQSHPWIASAEESVWSGIVFHTYVKLKTGGSPTNLESKIREVLNNFPDDPTGHGKQLDLRLQPITDIHLKSNRKFELEANGDISNVYIFSTIALMILLVAIINYSNLATARHTQRFKEVAVRKVIGASRIQIAVQFILESFTITMLALGLVVVIIGFARPFLTLNPEFANIPVELLRPEIILSILGITFFIGIVTGILPALAVSAFNPLNLLKLKVFSFSKGVNIRKSLVVAQFAFSILLTICTIITFKQVRFLKEAKLGYAIDHTLVLNIGYKEVQSKYAVLKAQLLRNSSILGVTASSQLPADIQTSENIDISTSESLGVYCISVDKDFFNVMDIPVREGQEQIATLRENDSSNFFVLNDRAIASIGWKAGDILNKSMSIRHGNMKPGPVVGSISDFHFQSLHSEIQPLVLEFNPSNFQYLLVKVKPDNLKETIQTVENEWKNVADGIPFEYMFLDQEYERLYEGESFSGILFMTFSIITILISSLGLFGLSAFSVARRTKEIGIRKVMGASIQSILLLISKEFTFLLIVSFLLAAPIGYYLMNAWLSNFSYKTTFGMEVLLASGIINGLWAMAALAFHSWQASRIDPVHTLKAE